MASIKTKDLDKTSPKYAYTDLWPQHYYLQTVEEFNFKPCYAKLKMIQVKDVPCKANDICVFSRSSLAGNFFFKCFHPGKMAVVGRPECVDFLQFQGILKRMRELDDKIIYALNTRLPTESFRGGNDSSKACEELFGELQENFKKREEAIQNCISFAKDKVTDLKRKKESNTEDISIHKQLKKEQSKLRLLQAELGVEEVVKDKTSKVIYERCRMHYIPPNFLA